MVLQSMHECMHATQFCSAFFFCQSKLLLGFLCYEDDSFTILLYFDQGSAVSCQICQKQKVDERDFCGTRGIGLWLWTPLCFAHAQQNRSGFNRLHAAHRESSFSSCECGNAILQYCYGFNRLQLWLLAQGLFQSVLSFQVSVAMSY